MIAWWMIQSLTIGVLLALAGRGVESVLKSAGRPMRWVWALALLLTVGLTAIVPLRNRASATKSVPQASAAPGNWQQVAPVQSGVPAMIDASARAFGQLVHVVGAPARTAWKAVAPSSAALSGWLGGLWSVLAGGVALVFAFVLVRYHRARHGWPVAVLQGTRVRVSASVGPAVMGVARAEIIVPQWLLARADEEQSLVLAHEREHLHAHDPLLLAAACVAIIVLPWNPAVWWMLSRLRLAVELDCDRRLLRRGISKCEYGNLLIELTGHRPGMRLAMPAFACNASHLERRLLAMTASRPRYLAARAVGISVVSLLGLLAACESRLPTAAEISNLDVASAEKQIGQVVLADTGEVIYVVNGVRISKEKAREIPAADIASVEVLKAASRDPKRVVIETRKFAALDATAPREVRGEAIGYARTEERSREPMTVRLKPDASAKRQFEGLLVIDDVQVDASALEKVVRDDIESIEVIKGLAATQKFSDPRAVNGVILIKTKLKKLDLQRIR